MAHASVVEPVVEHKIKVAVSYNGLTKEFEVSPSSTVGELVQHAGREFHITEQPHVVALFNTDGKELPDASSLRDAGVENHAVLLLRTSAVKGGTA